MANQAIALQARAPQMPSLSGAIQQNAMLINQMTQAQASRRQAEKTQQEMALAKSKEAREVSEAQVKYAGEVAALFREELKILPPGDVRGAEALRRMTVERVPGWDAILPSPEAIANDTGTRRRLMMKADEIISYSLAKPVASAQQDEKGNFYGVTVGGLGAPKAEKVVITPTLPEAKAPPASPQKIIDDGVAAILEGAGVNDPRLQNLDEKQLREIQSRASQQLLAKPISYEPGAVSDVEPLTMENAPQIVQAALDSGFIDPSHVQQLKQMLPQENQAAVDQWVQQSGLKVQPGLPGMRSAVYRPQAQDFGAPVADDGMAFGGPRMPMAQQIVNEPGTQFRGKPPMQSPSQSPSAAGAVSGAQAAGQGAVDVVIKPKIAGGTKTAELQAQKDMAFPDAQAQFEAALATIDNRLDDIARFRKHPAATRVIGPLDAFTPNFGRARGAQAIYDALVATATLDELQQMRQNSPTGGALGNVSDADIRVLRQSIGALGQDQSEEDFNESLRIFEDRLKQARERLIRRYKENYGYKLGKTWQPPAAGQRRTPTAKGRRVGGFTVMEVED